MTIRDNYQLKNFTTMAIGGPARFFIDFESVKELQELLSFAKEHSLPWVVVGEGSNLVPADAGYAGIVVRNRIDFLKCKGSKVNVGAGANLFAAVKKLNQTGLAGFEQMAGITGTGAGAAEFTAENSKRASNLRQSRDGIPPATIRGQRTARRASCGRGPPRQPYLQPWRRDRP